MTGDLPYGQHVFSSALRVTKNTPTPETTPTAIRVFTSNHTATATPTPVPTPRPKPTATATPTATAQASNGARPLGGDWKEIFDDEFNGSALDTSKWMPCYHDNNCTNSSNNEQEWYLPDNVSETNGVLTLTALKQSYTASNGVTYPYTSGMITSINFSYTYGYAEMRAKIAPGKGMWSAFWMLPTDGSWPPELDAQEILGKDPTAAHLSYHYGSDNKQQLGTWRGSDFTAGWHTFGVDWEPKSITWYIDGVAVKQITSSDADITSKPMYLLADLAVGGSGTWAGAPDSSTAFPSQYQIDYIRVWQQPTASISTSVTQGS